MGREVDKTVFKQSSQPAPQIVDLKEVGHYALQIVWNDGHDAGLYRWDMLREWCPCPECEDS
jgi:DUF971 family protein